MILPAVLFYLVWCYGPMYGIIIAFNDFSPKKGILSSKWVGLQWFRDFFQRLCVAHHPQYTAD